MAGRYSKTTGERFLEKVIKTSNGCWEWAAGKDPSGYGHFKLNGRKRGAHCAAFELFVGAVPAGHQVLHDCDHRPCVNPKHLFTGTVADNMADKKAKGRQARGVTHAACKLTEADVRRIREACGTYRSIALSFGVTETTISRICKRQTWKHLT